MTLKDDLVCQIFTAVMYRKTILFEDLSVNNDGKEGEEIYVSPKVVEIYDRINKYQVELGFKPPKLIYEPVSVGRSGLYTNKSDFRAETIETMKDMFREIVEMEQLF